MAGREKNSERSKQAILDAAEAQFAEKGFYGARIDEIAAQANINKRMIYEYYVNKETLYETVLFTVYGRMEEAERELIEKGATGVRLIREIVYTYFDFLRDNPSFVSLLMWENLNRAQFLDRLPKDGFRRATIRYFVEELRRGKESGIFRRELDEEQTAVSLITVCFANFSNRYTLSRLFDRDLTGGEELERRKEHTARLILAYVCDT